MLQGLSPNSDLLELAIQVNIKWHLAYTSSSHVIIELKVVNPWPQPLPPECSIASCLYLSLSAAEDHPLAMASSSLIFQGDFHAASVKAGSSSALSEAAHERAHEIKDPAPSPYCFS